MSETEIHPFNAHHDADHGWGCVGDIFGTLGSVLEQVRDLMHNGPIRIRHDVDGSHFRPCNCASVVQEAVRGGEDGISRHVLPEEGDNSTSPEMAKTLAKVPLAQEG